MLLPCAAAGSVGSSSHRRLRGGGPKRRPGYSRPRCNHLWRHAAWPVGRRISRKKRHPGRVAWLCCNRIICNRVSQSDTAAASARNTKTGFFNMKAGTDDLINEITIGLQFAISKFPENIFIFPALIEEVGELAKALMEESPERIRAEAIQVAVMAIRIIQEGDRDITQRRFIRGEQ